MTKSTITRERLEELASGQSGFNLRIATLEESQELARMALATLTSEPVAEVYQPQNAGICAPLGPSIRMLCPLEPGEKLYRHAQPAPEYPEVLPCPVLLEPGLRFGKGVKTRLVLDAIQRRAEHYAELEAMTPEERAEYDAGIEAFKAMLPQPAPQSPGSDHATVPGKWIPVSEQKPDCWCRTCRPVVLNDMRFVVCPDCGNKRCPRANNHRNACTGSNEHGQEGSAYPDILQEPKP